MYTKHPACQGFNGRDYPPFIFELGFKTTIFHQILNPSGPGIPSGYSAFVTPCSICGTPQLCCRIYRIYRSIHNPRPTAVIFPPSVGLAGRAASEVCFWDAELCSITENDAKIPLFKNSGESVPVAGSALKIMKPPRWKVPGRLWSEPVLRFR